VCEFGVDVLSPEQKTPFFQYLLYVNRNKIADHKEFRIRSANSEITEDKIRSIVYSITGDLDEADKAASYLVLQQTKPGK